MLDPLVPLFRRDLSKAARDQEAAASPSGEGTGTCGPQEGELLAQPGETTPWRRPTLSCEPWDLGVWWEGPTAQKRLLPYGAKGIGRRGQSFEGQICVGGMLGTRMKQKGSWPAGVTGATEIQAGGLQEPAGLDASLQGGYQG